MRGQVAVAEQSTVGPAPGVDFARDGAAVEVIRGEAQSPAAIRRRALLRLDQQAQGAGEVGMPGLLVAVEQAQRWGHDGGERLGAVTVQQRQAGVESAGDSGSLDTLTGD